MRAAQPEPLPLDVAGTPRPRPEDALSLAELGLDLRVTQPDPAWLSRRACTPTSLHPELTSEAAEYAASHGDRWIVGVMRDDNADRDGWWAPGMPHRLKTPASEPQETALFAVAADTPEPVHVPDPPKVWQSTPVARESFAADVRAAKAECLACPVMTQCRASAVHVTDTSGVAGGWTEGQRDTYRAHHGIPAPDGGLDRTDPDGLSLSVLAQIDEMTTQGMTAEQIAEVLDSPEITATTVDYARQLKSGSKARRAA